MPLRCAVLDDFQDAALASADWSPVEDRVEIVTFREHISDEDELAGALADFDIVVTLRERVPFPAGLFDRLPRLKLLVASGMRNSVIDHAAAHGLGYWAARHHPVTDLVPLPGADSAASALDAVTPIAERDGGFPTRLARVRGLPTWATSATVTDPDAAHRHLTELVRAATHRYATHGHGEATMLVHAATAPNAVLRVLPALPRPLWAPSLRAAWTASAAVTAMYAPDAPAAYTPPGNPTPEEVVELALEHGDEHVIKLTDTALDVGDERALAAALRSIELSEPLG
ncbi:hypothetical protein ACFCYB_32940 [Streptomyces sp. NPDC056309]|uniref:hypothetical protein n=1 Tax=Streptomyces sp. NPDC056309 TaxID=3345781 RepID=UPI0035D8B0B3